ncbi:hypothetical protein JCM19046_4949 [Bacillus sp. JCM 19046]|nr:hypothetical protein JCM19046_4949 [Bacillus sp. JCM 19046]
MFDISAALSGAIVAQSPDTFDGTDPNTAAGDLRADASNLVAEHFALATLGMAKEFKDALTLTLLAGQKMKTQLI